MIKPEDLRKMTPAQRAALRKAELAARQKAQMKKASASTGTRPAPKPMGQKKKVVVLKNPVEKKIESGLKFLFGDKSTATGKNKPGVAKKAAPSPRIQQNKKPLPAVITNKSNKAKTKPTLDDFLTKGKKPPMKIKPGLKRPSDADVILKGYNDPKTLKKYKK